MVKEVLRAIADRRKSDVPVSPDRRRSGMKHADERLRHALERIQRATKVLRREVANDIQQVVRFETFAEICTYNSRQGEFRLCKNPDHEAANTGIAKCNDELCPLMRIDAKASG